MDTNHTRQIESLIRKSSALKDQNLYEEQLSVLRSLQCLAPENNDYLSELALCLIRTGDAKSAVEYLIPLVLSAKGNLPQYKTLLVAALSASPVRHYYADCKQAIEMCLQQQYDCDTQPLFFSWLNQVIHSPETHALNNPIYHLDQTGFNRWMAVYSEEAQESLSDRFFLLGLETLIIAEPLLEFFLTRLRRYLCLNLARLGHTSEIQPFRPILYALAQQCFINEYVYLVQEDELEVLDSLRSPQRIFSEEAVSLLACYSPLYECFNHRDLDHLLNAQVNNLELRKLLKIQYLDCIKEKLLQDSIESFAIVKDPVSIEVRTQYEQNPYPRWLSISSTPGPLDDTVNDHPDAVLVAGCGTGQHAISAAARYPNAHILAVDLSKTSLGYAARKAVEAGSPANQIQFMQADILSMQDWENQFDIIESCGVLHHMAEPLAGIRALVNRLKPGGYFKLGLYSRTARAPLNLARDYVKEQKLVSDPDTIRRMRYVLLNQPADSDVYRFFVNSVDFYTISRVRDAIFNVQEHQFDLTEIQEILETFDLEFIRFTLNRAYISKAYKERFPQDPDQSNLENWRLLENDYPRLFSGMYQFWVRKSTDECCWTTKTRNE